MPTKYKPTLPRIERGVLHRPRSMKESRFKRVVIRVRYDAPLKRWLVFAGGVPFVSWHSRETAVILGKNRAYGLWNECGIPAQVRDGRGDLRLRSEGVEGMSEDQAKYDAWLLSERLEKAAEMFKEYSKAPAVNEVFLLFREAAELARKVGAAPVIVYGRDPDMHESLIGKRVALVEVE